MGYFGAFGFGFPSSHSSLSAMSLRAFSRLCSRAPTEQYAVLPAEGSLKGGERNAASG
jgi:membrane-associated phospholipid phosphatase